MLNRLKARWRLVFNHAEDLNKRVEVENALLKMAGRTTSEPTKEQCRILALKLGTPKKYWPAEWNKFK